MAAYDNAEMPRAPTSYGPPLVDFGAGIASLPDSYYQGKEMKRDYDIKRALQGGLPVDQGTGKADYTAAANQLFKVGGMDQGLQLANTGMQMEQSRQNAALLGGGAPGGSPQPQPQPRPTAPVFAPPPDQSRPQVASPDQGNNGGDTVRNVMAGMFGDRDVSKSMLGIAQSIGAAGVDAPLTPQQVAQLKQRLGPGQERMQPQQAPQPQQQAPQPQSPTGDPSGLTPPGWQHGLPAYRSALARAISNPATSAGDRAALMENMKAINTYLAKDAERTGEQKNALDPSVAQAAGSVELEKKVADAQGKAIGSAIEAGPSAQKKIQSLAIMKDALTRGDGNISTGPFAELMLHGKQAIGNLFGIDVSGTTEAEVTQKIGFQLATQAVKEITGRPTQFEFGKALENNPGLLLSPKGSHFMIDVLGQSARHDIELSKLAQRRENWANWPEVQDKFYQAHPIMSPFDRKVPLSEKDLSVLSAGAPPTAAGAPQQNAAPAAQMRTFNSPAEVDAAKLPSGTPFKLPDGRTGYAR